MDEFNFKPAQYCINKIFELTKSYIWDNKLSSITIIYMHWLSYAVF